MVSDVLADAVVELDEYLSDDWYGNPGDMMYDLIRMTRDRMEALRAVLDAGAAPEEFRRHLHIAASHDVRGMSGAHEISPEAANG